MEVERSFFLIRILLISSLCVESLQQGNFGHNNDQFLIGSTLQIPRTYNNLRIPKRRHRTTPPPLSRPAPPRAGTENGDVVGYGFQTNETGSDANKFNPRIRVINVFNGTEADDGAVFADPIPQETNSSSNEDQPLSSPPFAPAEALPPPMYDLPVYDLPGDDTDDDGPLPVDVAIQIQSVRDIDEENQKIILEIDLTVHWKDYELLPKDSFYESQNPENLTKLFEKYDALPMHQYEFNKLWKPDIFIERVDKIRKPELLGTPVLIRTIKESSSVIFTARASVKLDCDMDFQYYPADTQECYIDIRSYQNDEYSLNLRWNPLPGAFLVNPDSDDNFDIQLSHVAQRKKLIKDVNLNNAVFDVLQMKLSMRRKLSYHVIQTYVPSAFLVFITWLSFLIPEDLVEARIGISMTNLLTLTAMFAAVRESTPIVSYVKAIDIWMVYCIFIVFSTLLEFAIFVWLRNYKVAQREKKLQNMVNSTTTGPNQSKAFIAHRLRRSSEEISSKAIAAFETTAKWFNRCAFAYFVLNFTLFNVIYWPWLFLSSNHCQWKMNSTLNGMIDDWNDGFLDEL